MTTLEEESTHEVTGLLEACKAGEKEALDRLIPLVFEDLRRLARRYFTQEAPGHTLQPTAVIHEVYLRLVGERITHVANRRQFFAVASRLIRRVLVDHARTRQAVKRGGGAPKDELGEIAGARPWGALDPEALLGLHQALTRLEELDPRPARLVELKYFCGLTLKEASEVLETSLATVERDWSFARRWLSRELA
ncbi:MAG: sigma-70 family RNA polymerase sigma factor [Acidobacteria bacterium]|nr:sigma-70 family RNA polymerase sigma factor [Acidobacteriota bacterium]